MKILLLLLILVIGVALVYKYVIADDIPVILKQKIAGQDNPFTVPKDSETVVWSRALQLLEGRKRLLSGGKLVQTDSTLFLPYYSDNHKGNSMLIERHQLRDSVIFKVSWWHSRSLQDRGSKEVALFMQKRISRYRNF